MVYFIEADGTGRVKIGYAMGGKPALMSRLESLQTGCPLALTAIAVLPGGQVQERALHRRFHDLHQRGEWFLLEGDLAKLVDSCRLRHPLRLKTHVPRAVREAKPKRNASSVARKPESRMRAGRWHALDALFDD